MTDPALISAAVEKLTLIVALAWALIAFARGWVVPASIHKAVLDDRDDWKVRHDKIASIAEMALRAKVGGGA